MRGRRLFIACYATSGTAALVYQVAWTRLFALQLGHTTAASSTVLAAFMGGLAAGAWAGGNLGIITGPSLLRWYAGIELFIGAIAIVLPWTLDAVIPALSWAYADGTAPAFFATFRVGFSLLLIGIPAAAMGATFPLAVSWLAAERSDTPAKPAPGAGAGILYAANTMGAAIGAIAAGFWLIPALGLRTTAWCGVALNVGAAAGALWIARRPIEPVREHKQKQKKKRAAPVTERMSATPPRPLLAAVAAGLSGFLALVYEVAWTRLLALVLGPTTYAFSIMAASFITGIAVGSFMGTRVARRSSNPAAWLGGTLILTAVSAPAAAWFAASRLPMFVAARVNAGAGFDTILLQQVVAVAGVLLPTSIALGASFVLALAAATGETAHVAKDVAHVYVANTAGAVAGALTAGFLLIPALGLQQTFNQISAVGASGGVLIAAAALSWRRPRTLAAAASLIGAVWIAFNAVPAWDREILSSGGYKYARGLDPAVLDEFLRAGRLEYYKEGAAGTVSVRALAGSRSLAIDGKVDASNAGDMLTQRLLGLLPVLLHPGPRETLVIGLGSGVTADAVLATDEVERVDVVEISPAVVEASAYFERENRGILKNPRTRLLIADGRSHLRLSRREYDVVVSEPSNPWMGGVAALFTREFFEAARDRLRPGGVFCQWAHTYEIAENDLRSIVRTFAAVFPEGTMWLVGESDLLLIGSTERGFASRLSGLEARSGRGAAPALLSAVGIPQNAAAFVLLSMFAGAQSQLAAFGDGAPLQTDDRMALEFTAPRAMYAPPEGNAARLSGFTANAAGAPPAVAAQLQLARAPEWTARGNVALQAKAFAMASDSFRRALIFDSQLPGALRGLTESAAGAQRLPDEAGWLQTLAASEPGNIAVRVELSHTLAALGRTDEAIAMAAQAGRLDPRRPEPLEQLASIFADTGDATRLSGVANELATRFPDREDARYYQAAALFLAGRPIEAERPIRLLLSVNPRHAKGQNLLGALCASAAKPECAERAFTAARELDPRDPSVYVNLGYLRLARGDAQAAAEFFREALAIDTRSEAARRGLDEAGAGHPGGAGLLVR